MGKAAVLSIFLITILLVGCGLGMTDEEIAGTVEVKVGIAVRATLRTVDSLSSGQTVTLAETLSPTTTPSPTNTPIPTRTPLPTNSPIPTIDWSAGLSTPFSSYFETTYDEFEERTFFFPNVLSDVLSENSSALVIVVVETKDEAPRAIWSANYFGSDRIFLKGIKVRVSGTTYDLSDNFDFFDVSTNMSGGVLHESVQFPFSRNDLPMLEHLITIGSGTIRFDGSEGNEDIPLTDSLITSWKTSLALYLSLGGNLDY